MKTKKQIQEYFKNLSKFDQLRFIETLLLEYELQEEILDEAGYIVKKKRKRKICPHCASKNVYKRGKQNQVQMYQCNDCKKWYSETTGTPIFSIKKKEKWQLYIECMEKGMSIRNSAEKVDISIQTSFDWRHKILSTLEQFVPEKICGEVQCDEMELSLSNKGERKLERKPRKRGNDFKRNSQEYEDTVVQVVATIQDNGEKYLRAVVSKKLTKNQVKAVLDNKLAEDSILITDKSSSFKAFCKEKESIIHKTVLSSERVDRKNKRINLQRVNNTHSQIRKFLRPFNGVSSKYLQNYLNWYAYRDKIRNNKTTLKMWLFYILMSDFAYNFFTMVKQNAVLIRT